MIIGRVVGETVATQKHPSHEGLKLLLVAPADLDGNPLEDTAPFVAVDSVDAGVGDRVLLATDGWAAMTAIDRPGSPIDAAVVGVIDHIDIP
jgi:ethanolamine utilization protein EutN